MMIVTNTWTNFRNDDINEDPFLCFQFKAEFSHKEAQKAQNLIYSFLITLMP